jgi:oxygen-dependent protoporphyrinogen oxidase
VLRLSVGRAGEVSALQRPDDDLAAAALADAEGLLDRELPASAVTVTRWGGALPQYGVGHLDLVDEVLAAVGDLPGLAVAGSVYGGVGVPACIATADAAAARVLDHVM